MRLSRLLLPVAVASVWLVAFGVPSASAGMKFANLTGAQEVPGPADPDGSAAAMLTLRPASGQVCVAQRHSNIDAPIAMHIHRGAAGVAGPILVDLTPTLTGSACVTANMTTVRRIDRNPNGYYLNIHTGTFSNGAIRGQLDSSMVGSSMPTTAGPTRLFGRMDGAQERPGPGDADGRGSVFIDLKPAAGQVCVDERYQAIANPVALMHIHTGAAGVGGPILINLTPALNGGPRCVNADPTDVRAVRMNPAGFYCNIHNMAFPNGAIRGQLEASTP
jgi:hypothetical protein